MLTISGEKKKEKTYDSDNFHRKERNWGRFCRSMTVPQGITEKDISAKFENGVLKVCIPRMTGIAGPDVKRINIQ